MLWMRDRPENLKKNPEADVLVIENMMHM